MLLKKGASGDQAGIVWFLLLAAIIGASIGFAIWIFYGSGYDFREAEANLLNYKIKECMIKNEITEAFFDKNNFYNLCGLNKEIIEKNNLIKICDGFREDCIISKEYFFIEGSNFNICGLNEKDKSSSKCSIQNFEKDRKRYIVITASNQLSRRIQG